MFKVRKTLIDSKARLGILETLHGRVETPVFMPVGSQATVKAPLPGAPRSKTTRADRTSSRDVSRSPPLAGRLLLHRDPFTFEFDKVISEAVRRGVWLEVNASPERLDLSANHVRAAKAKGAKFIVSTDAHHPNHLLNMKYGILTARRGGLEAGDIINSYPADQFVRALRRE